MNHPDVLFRNDGTLILDLFDEDARAVLTQTRELLVALKRQMFLPLDLVIVLIQGGDTKLATPVLLKLRHEYDVALKAGVEAMNLAKQKGVFNPEVGAMFAQAKVKKIPWLLLRDAMRAFYQRVANDGKSMTLDTGFGPWPCQGMAFTKGNFALAVRVLKDDMTAEAKKARAAYTLAWRKEQEIKRLQQELDGYGDIPLI